MATSVKGSPRLKIPSVQARSARSAFKEDIGFTNTDPLIIHVPIVQWRGFRIRGLCIGAGVTLDIAYVRPAKEPLRATIDADTPPVPPSDDAASPLAAQAMAGGPAILGAYEYTTGQPTTAQLVLAIGTEGMLPVIEADHVGENWLQVTITPASTLSVLRFLDFSGDNVGTYG